MSIAVELLVAFLLQLENVPAETPLPAEPAPLAAQSVAEPERARLETMFSKFVGMKLKGKSFEQTFRRRLLQPEPAAPFPDELATPPPSDGEGPHTFGFRAALPSEEKDFTVRLIGAEILGPRRYRLALEVSLPLPSIGGYYAFDGNGRIGLPIGWRADQISARVAVSAVLDLGWKNLASGAIGIYAGGFIDESLTQEERQSARLIEDLRIDLDGLDLSLLNLEGINGRRIFVRNGVGVGRGGLLRRALGTGQREQIESMIAGGVNNLIRQNEVKLLEGINAALQAELPETQIQVTSFIEKLAIQANLAGKKIDTLKPPKPTTDESTD
jgi:hypothetical protein